MAFISEHGPNDSAELLVRRAIIYSKDYKIYISWTSVTDSESLTLLMLL
jgi:hypothetical protein